MLVAAADCLYCYSLAEGAVTVILILGLSITLGLVAILTFHSRYLLPWGTNHHTK